MQRYGKSMDEAVSCVTSQQLPTILTLTNDTTSSPIPSTSQPQTTDEEKVILQNNLLSLS